MKVWNICIFIFTVSFSYGQNQFSGNYEGIFNGDKVTLTLVSSGGANLSGTMKDSQSSYVVTGKANKNTFNGNAVENTLGINLSMTGTLNSNIFNAVLSFDFFGEVSKMDVIFNKIIATNQNSKLQNAGGIPNKTRDHNLIGTWVKESNYSSGYSSNNTYGAMSTRESMVFFGDGSLGDGGSSTVVGGNNFSGSSSGQATGTLPGVYWWTEQNKIYLHITEKGTSQQLELGKYYIENGRMLITASNGEKLLLTKQ